MPMQGHGPMSNATSLRLRAHKGRNRQASNRYPRGMPHAQHLRRGSIFKKLLITLAVVLGLGIILVALEAFAGATARPTIANDYGRQLHDLVLEQQRARLGPEAADGLNQRPAFVSVMQAVREANEWLREHADELTEQDEGREDAYDDPWRYLSLDIIYAVPDEGTPEQFERGRQRAIDALQEWERRGVFDRSAELVDMHLVARAPGEGPMVDFLLPYLGVGRQLARAQAARARLAAEAGDLDTLYSALEETYVLGRQIAGQGLLIDWLVGAALHGLGRRMLLDNLLLYPVDDEAWLERVDAMIQREAIDRYPPIGDSLRGERLFAADFTQRCYTDNGKGNGRFIPVLYAKQIGQDPPDAGTLLTPFGDSRFSNMHGRLFLDRRELDAWIDRAHELAHASAEATGANAIAADNAFRAHVTSGDDWRNPASNFIPSFRRTIVTARGMRIEAAGTRVVLAIERYRLRNGGAIPRALDQLGDLLPDDLRADPFTAEPWDYQPTPVAETDDGDPLLPGAHAWPFTLESKPLAGGQSSSSYRHAHNGLLITEPIQGPQYYEPFFETTDGP